MDHRFEKGEQVGCDPRLEDFAGLGEDIDLVGGSSHGVENGDRVATLTHAVCRKGERHRQGRGQVESERRCDRVRELESARWPQLFGKRSAAVWLKHPYAPDHRGCHG